MSARLTCLAPLTLLLSTLVIAAPSAGATVTPPGTGYTRPQLEQIVRDAAVLHGANAARLAAVVECESKWDPYAVGDRGRSRGLLQFHCETPDCVGSLWAGLWPDVDPLPSRDEPEAAADAAARAWALGAAGHWSCWRMLYRGERP